MMRRAGLVLGVAVTVLGLTSCGSRPESGTVVGDYRVTGGAPPGVDHLVPATIWAYKGRIDQPDETKLVSASIVRNTDSSGRFSLMLAPGEYTLFGAPGLSQHLRSALCGAPVVIQVKASMRQTAELVCSVP